MKNKKQKKLVLRKVTIAAVGIKLDRDDMKKLLGGSGVTNIPVLCV